MANHMAEVAKISGGKIGVSLWLGLKMSRCSMWKVLFVV